MLFRSLIHYNFSFFYNIISDTAKFASCFMYLRKIYCFFTHSIFPFLVSAHAIISIQTFTRQTRLNCQCSIYGIRCLLQHLSGISMDIPTRTHVDYSDLITLSCGLIKVRCCSFNCLYYKGFPLISQ